MEEKLKQLFDYQRFARDPHLEKLIDAAESGDCRALGDDELTLVNAAGEPTGYQKPHKDI